jgi:hypothetical protein
MTMLKSAADTNIDWSSSIEILIAPFRLSAISLAEELDMLNFTIFHASDHRRRRDCYMPSTAGLTLTAAAVPTFRLSASFNFSMILAPSIDVISPRITRFSGLISHVHEYCRLSKK